MEKTATLNLRVNPVIKEGAEAVVPRLGVPMTTTQLHEKLQKGYEDIEAGRVQNAADAFARFRESHKDETI